MQAKADKKMMNRWFPMISGMVIQLALGVPYIWSVFQPYVMEEYTWDSGTTAFTFSILLAVFVLGNIVGGKLQDKYAPQYVVFGGGVVMALGLLLAMFTPASSPWYLYLTFGGLGGFGIGATYTTVIACCQKWFVDKKGLATGLIVCSVGLSGVVFTPVAKFLLSGYGLKKTFLILAIVLGAICVVGAVFTKNPPEGYLPKNYTPPVVAPTIKVNYTTTQMLKTKRYYLLTLSLFFAVPAYFMVNPLMVTLPTERGLSEAMALSVVMIASLMNAGGRFAAPFFSDKIGRINTILALFVITMAAVVGVSFAGGLVTGILMVIITFAYGGFLGIYAAVSSDLFGFKYAGANYGIVLIGFGISSLVSPQLAKMVKEVLPGGGMSFIVAGVASIIGFIFMLLLKADLKKQKN